MTAPAWQPGKLYSPGALVTPTGSAAPVVTSIANPSFESGATGWDVSGGASIVNTAGFSGGWSVRVIGSNGGVTSQTRIPVRAGQTVTASCMGRLPNGSAGTSFDCNLNWYDAGGSLIGTTEGTPQIRKDGTGWRKSTVTGAAPANAASFSVRGDGNVAVGGEIFLDVFSLDAYTYVGPPSGLVYKAVQAAIGASGATEPAWPDTLGVQVVDNQVTWEAALANRVEWEATPILKSGGAEPTWPTTPGEFVDDNGIHWECVVRHITDPNCPNSTVVAITDAKVFAGDGDITRFCATGNPLDWTTKNDAGYLPTGLSQNGANDIAVLNLYRSNLAAFNASNFGMWQTDPDPDQMALLDAMEGIGSTWQKAAQPVSNDLFFLTALGVRSVGIAGASTNLQAGDVGMPIDPLVQAKVRALDATTPDPRATFYPAAGQYWIAFPSSDPPPPPPVPVLAGDVPDGILGDAVATAYTVTGGVQPYGPITVVSGTFPSGLALASDGTVSGNFDAIGTFSWRVQVVDAIGQVAELDDTALVSSFFLTSVPYPVEVIEDMTAGAALTASRFLTPPVDFMQSSASLQAGDLRQILKTYTWPPENVQSVASIQSGELRQILKSYDAWPPENLQSQASLQAGELKRVLVTYTNWPAESVQSSCSIVSGVLQ